MPANTSEWATKPLTPEYLLNSGILFELNRTYLNLLGISLVVQKNDEGKVSLELKDHRHEPEKLVFERSTMIRGQEKHSEFLEKFGSGQMDRRRKYLGWACQPRVDPNAPVKKDKK